MSHMRRNMRSPWNEYGRSSMKYLDRSWKKRSTFVRLARSHRVWALQVKKRATVSKRSSELSEAIRMDNPEAYKEDRVLDFAIA